MGPVVALDSVAVIVFIGLLLSRRFDDAPPGRFLHWRGNHTLSTLSYSLYAAHTPVVIFLFAVARRLLGPAPSVLALMGATIAVLVATRSRPVLAPERSVYGRDARVRAAGARAGPNRRGGRVCPLKGDPRPDFPARSFYFPS
ncbi:MAG: hypothetical protein U1E28_15460 [Beijerinckiaceae bacterium]